MKKRYNVIVLTIAVMLVLTACSFSGQVLDGEGMVRSYTQISQEEARQLMEKDGTQIIVDVRTQEEYDSAISPVLSAFRMRALVTENEFYLQTQDMV